MSIINDKTILITGGTGSFGKQFVRLAVNQYRPKKLIIFSRDEMKQYEMSKEFSREKYPFIRYFIGDIRDEKRLYRAFHGVDIVIHAAALKIITSGEFNPSEVIKTNIHGMENIINAAIDQGVKKVLALSTDKAVNPVNLYGASKLAAEKLAIAANNYSGDAQTQFSCVRYGNVINSRGSVIPHWLKEKEKGYLSLTDVRMTRFFVTLGHVCDFVVQILNMMKGREVFIPKIPSMKMTDLADVIASGIDRKIIGIRAGEKLNEDLISCHESRHCVEFEEGFIILPEIEKEYNEFYYGKYKKISDDFEYRSDLNHHWVSKEEMKKIVEEIIRHG